MSEPKSPEDVLKTLVSDFRRHVDAKAIAPDARIQGIIPERVEKDILDAKTRNDANLHLFDHLCSQARYEDIRKLCSIMKEADGYPNMKTFAGETLQAELDKSLPVQECAATDRSLVRKPTCEADSGVITLPAKRPADSAATRQPKLYNPSHSREVANVVQKDVARGEFKSLRSLAGDFVVTVSWIVECLNTESMLAPLKTAARSEMKLQGVPNPPSKADINNANDVQQLFDLLNIDSNWVDISLLEQIVKVSRSKAATDILAKYKESHESVISEALAQLVDPSTDGTCPRPDANSCIFQLVFNDRREGMRVQEILACKDFLYDRFGVQPESIRYISAVIGNSLVVTWLVSRHTGFRIVNQCRSPPVLAALRTMEVLAVHLQYPGQLISVEVDVNLGTSESYSHLEETVPSGYMKQVQKLTWSGVDVNEAYMVDELLFGGSLSLIAAIKEGLEDVALKLIDGGADIHVKDKDGRTALHWACDKGLEEVVEVVIRSQVDGQDLFGCTPVMLAAESGNTAISMDLVQAGASCKGLSKEHKSLLFHHACSEAQRDLAAVRTLLKGGCSIGILSKEEQEELFFHACRDSDMSVVECLIAHGCNVSCIFFKGYTPLMVAVQADHEEVVKKLILAGANVKMQDKLGNSALHYAAVLNHIACGILLAEGGASVRIQNNLSQTPLDLACAEFKEAINQALSFTTRKALCVIGNAGSGKSTLIAALQAESNSIWGQIVNRFKRVRDFRQRTAGIKPVFHHSQRYGEVLFFDFAGQEDYQGPHQMFMEALLSKPGFSMTFLLVVKMTEEEDAILHQLHRWLTPVALMSTPASPPQVIIIGSFLDKVESKEGAISKLTRCIEATREDMEELPLEFVGTSFLNCRQPQSKGLNKICKFFQDIPIPEFSATHARYSLAWVLSQINLCLKAPAVQLQGFTAWVQDNKDNLPQTMPPPEEVCRDLSAAGHAFYLPNKNDPPRSWLVLDLPSILHDVYGTLFSRCQYRYVNKYGLLHCHRLGEVFPCLDPEMVQQLLISLEFCLPVDPSVLKVELTELTHSEETSGWLFFPALISAKPPQSTLEVFPQQCVWYLCWQLRTAKKHSISARTLQTILLRLVHFVVKQHHCLLSPDRYGEKGIKQRHYSIWANGIAWQSKEGVDMTIDISNNRVIQVVGGSIASADKSCQYLTDVISDILSTVHRLTPKLAAAAYIVYPPKMATSLEGIAAPSPNELFPVEGIRSSIRDHKESALSLKDIVDHWNMITSPEDITAITPEGPFPEEVLQNAIRDSQVLLLSLKDREDHVNTMLVTDLFGGCTPSLEDIERINWPQSECWSFPKGSGVLQEAEGIGAPTGSHVIPSGAQALLDILVTPDVRDIDDLVVTEVAARWQRVALRLGVEGCVCEIIFKNYPNDYESACRDMLRRWVRGDRYTGEEERTWSTLLTALGRAGFEELERRLRREHFHK